MKPKKKKSGKLITYKHKQAYGEHFGDLITITILSKRPINKS